MTQGKSARRDGPYFSVLDGRWHVHFNGIDRPEIFPGGQGWQAIKLYDDLRDGKVT